jgi:Fe-Mn family superoxide dismutase
MSNTLFRSTAVRAALRASAPTAAYRAGLAGTSIRGKATLPDLSCMSASLHTIPSHG